MLDGHQLPVDAFGNPEPALDAPLAGDLEVMLIPHDSQGIPLQASDLDFATGRPQQDLRGDLCPASGLLRRIAERAAEEQRCDARTAPQADGQRQQAPPQRHQDARHREEVAAADRVTYRHRFST